LAALSHYTLGMQLLDGFFRSPSVEPLFSDTASVQAILDFEAALARAQARAGIISAPAAAAITSSCRVELFDLNSLAHAMPSAGNLAIPLLKQLNAIVARGSPDALRHVHYGATSQDALDTGVVLQLRSAVRAIDSDLLAIICALVELTAAHRKTLLVARTWLQHALPTTFGYITAGWLDAFVRHRERFRSLLDDTLALQFGGAAGTLAALGDRGTQVASFLAEELALPLPRIPWHSQRERIAETAATFGVLSGTLAKTARDLSLYMQTEVGELSEPPSTGRGGSSTMPHKQNPVASAAIFACTSRVPSLVSSVMSGISGEYQRSLGAWQSEWEVVPEIVRLTAGGSHQLAALLPRLTVNVDKMRSNLDLTRGLIYAEAVSLALSEKLNRASAHKLVEAACRRAQSEQRNLHAVLSEVADVNAILDKESLASLFEPANYLGSAELFIDAVLAAAGASTSKSSTAKG
jgi:3-carboxy-cis,cis-muconate cycloisomerase